MYRRFSPVRSFGVLGAQLGHARAMSEGHAVTAIDTLLVPDATMLQHAEAANTRLLKDFPNGFALGADHQPHISCLQCYVQTVKLDDVYDAVGGVVAAVHPETWELRAVKYSYVPWRGLGLAEIMVEPTDELLQFQEKLIDAIAPFTSATATADAYVATQQDPFIVEPVIDQVATFVHSEVGANFMPHVTIGVATEESLNKMLDEPFEPFTFSPAGVSIYHVGDCGAPAVELAGWDFTQ